MSNFLVGETPIENAVLRTEHENLWFLPSGGLPTDPAGLLNTKKMSDMIAEMKRRFDFIFIDAPPILGVSDASVIARETDMTMIIIQHRKLAEKTLLRVKQGIESAVGTIAGVVMNNLDVRSDSQYQFAPQQPQASATSAAAIPAAGLSKPAADSASRTEPADRCLLKTECPLF